MGNHVTSVVKLRILGPCVSRGGQLRFNGWTGLEDDGVPLIEKRLRRLTYRIPLILDRIMDAFDAKWRPRAFGDERTEAVEAAKASPLKDSKVAYDLAREMLTDIELNGAGNFSASAVCYNSVARQGESAFNTFTKDRVARAKAFAAGNTVTGKRKPSSFSAPHPIPIRGQGLRLTRETIIEPDVEVKGEIRKVSGYVLWASIFAGQGPTPLRVVGAGPGAWACLERLAESSYELGSTNIDWKKTKKGSGWYAHLTYYAERTEGIVREHESGLVLARDASVIPKPPKEGKRKPFGGRASRDPRLPTVKLVGRLAGAKSGDFVRVTGAWGDDGEFRTAYFDRRVKVLGDGYKLTKHDPGVYRKGTEVAAVVIGINNWVSVITTGGESSSWEGNSLLQAIRRHNDRARQIRRQTRTRGKGSRGRGSRKRRERVLAHSDAWSRATKTMSEQQASRVVRWCAERFVGQMVILDLSGWRETTEYRAIEGKVKDEVRKIIHQWPHYKLFDAIRNSAARYHIDVVRQKPKGWMCPACHAERVFAVDHQFRCPECGFFRDLDATRAMNLLLDAGADGVVSKAAVNQMKIYGAIKKAKRGKLPEGLVEHYAIAREELQKQREKERARERRAKKKAAREVDEMFVARLAADATTDQIDQLDREVSAEAVRKARKPRKPRKRGGKRHGQEAHVG